MNEPDPDLMQAYSVVRADRPRSGKGKAQTLAALGLAAEQASAAATSASASAPVRGAASWRWWSLGVAIAVVGVASFRVMSSEAPPAAKVASAPPPAIAQAAPIAPGMVATASSDVHVLAVDQLPNAGSDVSNSKPEPKSADAKLDAKPADAKAGHIKADTKVADTKTADTNTADTKIADTKIAQSHESPEATPSLRDEIEAIERASRALTQRRCALAKTHLAAYHAKFPNGRLSREAEVVAIEIAGRSGHDTEARTAARRFVAQFPDSPYAMRLAPWLHDGAIEGPEGKCLVSAE